MERYQQISMIYRDDDSARFRDLENGKEIWGVREYIDGKYTGRFVFEELLEKDN